MQSKKGSCTLGLRLAGASCWEVAAVTHPSGEQEEEVTSPTRSHLVRALCGQQDPGLGLEPQTDALGWMGNRDVGSSRWFKRDE